jgi:beta-phosphoglucomutase-like phosphatase (HAD superfamily)
MFKYAIHPDYVCSKTDGDMHYINARSLIWLYQLNPDKCLIIDDMKAGKRRYAELMAMAESSGLYTPIP